MDGSLAQRLRAAISVVRDASATAKALQESVVAGGLDIQKDDKSPVTVADFAVQALVLARLGAQFPEDSIIAEETSDALRASGEALVGRVLDIVREASCGQIATEEELCSAIDLSHRRATGRFCWVLDPIDGTRGFLHGEQFCVGLGLLDCGAPVLGVLGCPNDHRSGGRLFFAARGAGAYVSTPLLSEGGVASCSEQQIRVGSQASAAECIPKAVMLEGPFTDHARNAKVQQALGIEGPPMRLDSMVKYGRLSAGEGDLILRLPRDGYREHIWDHAAGAVLVEEAGGRITDQLGRPLDFSLGRDLAPEVRGIVASSGGALHDAALRALSDLRIAD